MTSAHSISQPSRKAPPSPPGYPFLGILPKLIKDPLSVLTQAAREYGGVVRLGSYSIGHDIILISHPSGIKHILQENYRNYNRGFNASSASLLIGRGLPMNEGESWLQQRRLLQPVFQAKHIIEFAPTIIEKTADTLASWQGPAKSGAPIDMALEVVKLTRDVILKTMFSMDMVIDDATTADMLQSLRVALEYIDQLVITPPPPLWVPTRRNRAFRKAVETFDKLVYQIIEKRRNSDAEANDLLAILLRACDPETGRGMSDQQLRDEVMTVFLAGHETTANTLSWIWYMLSQNPHVLEKLYDEVDSVLQGRPPSVDDLGRLPYSRMVISETLRIYPTGWLFSRAPLADDEIDGYTIPRGSLLLYSPYVTHHLPALWENPDTFDPERFTPEKIASLPRYTYIPFGAGPRQCIGNHFALMEIQLILTMMAQRYHIQLAPGQRVEPQTALTLRPKDQLLMIVQQRELARAYPG